MGYVHTNLSLFIPPTTFYGDTAAWAMAAGAVSDTIAYHADATDESADLYIPIPLPSEPSGKDSIGSKLKSIEIDFEVLVAACDAVSAVIRKITRGAHGAVAVVDDTTVFTYDSNHDTAAERLTLDQHRMTLTLTTPVYIDHDEEYYVVITFDKAATTTIDALGAVANYIARA